MRRSIRAFALTQEMTDGTSYECLQEFERLFSLTVADESIVNNLVDCCKIIDNLPLLEELTLCYAINDPIPADEEEEAMQEAESTIDDEADESALAATFTPGAAAYPKIEKFHVCNYSPLSINQKNDMLLIKRFNKLSNLDITFQYRHSTPANFHRLLVDSTILAYIQDTIPSYRIKFDTLRDDECQYLYLYCKGLEQMHHGISDKKVCLTVSLYEDEEEQFGSLDDFQGSMVVLKKDSKNVDDSSATIDGKISFYIGGGMDAFRRIPNVRRLLSQYNDVITETRLQLRTVRSHDGDDDEVENEDESNEIGQYIFGIRSFGRYRKVTISRGCFMNTPIEILHSDNDNLVGSNSRNDTQLRFENSGIAKDILPHISNAYPYLESLEFVNCKFRNIHGHLLSKTKIELPNTRVGKLCLFQDEVYGAGDLLFNNDDDTIVLLSVVSQEQEFETGYICTSLERRSIVQEVNRGLLDVFLASVDPTKVALVEVKARYIGNLVFIEYEEKEGRPCLFDVNITFSNNS